MAYWSFSCVYRILFIYCNLVVLWLVHKPYIYRFLCVFPTTRISILLLQRDSSRECVMEYTITIHKKAKYFNFSMFCLLMDTLHLQMKGNNVCHCCFVCCLRAFMVLKYFVCSLTNLLKYFVCSLTNLSSFGQHIAQMKISISFLVIWSI